MIKIHLRGIYPGETINQRVYTDDDEDKENNVFQIFNKFTEEEHLVQGFEGKGVSVGVGLLEFFQDVVALLPESNSAAMKIKTE